MTVLHSAESFGEKASPSHRFHRGPLAAAFLILSALVGSAVAQTTNGVVGAVVTDEVTVTDSRLRDRPTEGDRVAAHVTVIDREEITSSGAGTLQDLLAGEAGIVLFDATGSGIASTLDLRGFTGGGVKVFLDGAPLNDPRNNTLSLELVPPAALDRVEITRGSTAALSGGGSEAGVINLWTRRGESAGGRLSLAAGGYDTLEGSVAGWGKSGQADFFATASFHDTEGFRDNGAGELARFVAAAGWELAGGSLRLSLLDAGGDFGNPGALRPDELDESRWQAPFNQLDFSDERLTQATLNFDRAMSTDLSLTANLFARDRDNVILTTGRAAPAFGGFFLDSTTSLVGATGQLTRAADRHELAAGLEWLDGNTDARGVSTPPSDPGFIDLAAPASDNITARRTTSAYLQDRWRLHERLTLALGGRWDDEEVAYEEVVPDPANAARRTYSELSLRGGLTWAPLPKVPDVAFYASYGEAFLPPTVEELFSFPLFGSNPALRPEDSRSIELGLRRTTTRLRVQVALFRIDTRDEIVFDPDSPLGLFGSNVNAGETRREGLEIAYRAQPHSALRVFANATLVDAKFRGGDNHGNTVPLVPAERLGLGFETSMTASLSLRADVLWVGDQVLDNDDANLQPTLDSYSVLNARLVWESRVAASRVTAPRLFLAARNLLDEAYATRGIFAFDFSTFLNSAFLTPSPGRQLKAGIEWRF